MRVLFDQNNDGFALNCESKVNKGTKNDVEISDSDTRVISLKPNSRISSSGLINSSISITAPLLNDKIEIMDMLYLSANRIGMTPHKIASEPQIIVPLIPKRSLVRIIDGIKTTPVINIAEKSRAILIRDRQYSGINLSIYTPIIIPPIKPPPLKYAVKSSP